MRVDICDLRFTADSSHAKVVYDIGLWDTKRKMDRPNLNHPPKTGDACM